MHDVARFIKSWLRPIATKLGKPFEPARHEFLEKLT